MSKGNDTRQRIVAEAATLFNQRGFEGSAISNLMEVTGLQKGGIYRHFSSKQQIVVEAFDYAWKATFDAWMHDLGLIQNSVDRLERFVAEFVGQRSMVSGGAPLLNAAIEAHDRNLALRKQALKAHNRLRDRLSSIISIGIERKEIRPDVDSKELAIFIICSLGGALAMSRLERNQEALFAIQVCLERHLEAEVRLRA